MSRRDDADASDKNSKVKSCRQWLAASQLVACLLCASVVLVAGPKVALAKTINRVVAVINDEIITERDLKQAMGERRRAAGHTDQLARRQTLERLIDETLFNQLMAKADIEITDDELARAIANVLHLNRMTLSQLKKEVTSKGLTYDQYTQEVRRQVKRVKFINQVIGPQVKIADQDLRDYYQRHQERFRGTHQAHIATISLSLAGLTTQAEFERVRDLALDIVAQARRRKNSFAKLARKHSQGSNAAGGGDLGMMNLKELSPPIRDAVRQLGVGEVSNPILAENSVVIVKLISLPELSAKDFEKLRDEIYAALYDERIEETLNGYLRRERQKAFIEIR